MRPKQRLGVEQLEDRTQPSSSPLSPDLASALHGVRDAQSDLRGNVQSTLASVDSESNADLLALQTQLNTVQSQRQTLQTEKGALDSAIPVSTAITDVGQALSQRQTAETAMAPTWGTNSRTGLKGIDGVNGTPFLFVSVSPNGQQLLAIRSDGQATIRSVQTGAVQRTIATNLADIRGIEWSPDGQAFAVCGKPASQNVWRVQVWNTSSGAQRFEQTFGSTAVTDVHWTSDGASISANISPGQARLLNATNGTERLRISESSSNNRASALSKDGTIFYGELSPGVTAYSTANGSVLRRFRDLSGAVSAVAPSPNGQYLIVAGSNGQVLLYNAQTAALITQVTGTGGIASNVEWNDDGSLFLVTRSRAGTSSGITVFSVANGTCTQEQFIRLPGAGEDGETAHFGKDTRSVFFAEYAWTPSSYLSSIGAATLNANLSGSSALSAITLQSQTVSTIASVTPTLPSHPTTDQQLASIQTALTAALPTDYRTKTVAELTARRTDVVSQIATLDTQYLSLQAAILAEQARAPSIRTALNQFDATLIPLLGGGMMEHGELDQELATLQTERIALQGEYQTLTDAIAAINALRRTGSVHVQATVGSSTVHLQIAGNGRPVILSLREQDGGNTEGTYVVSANVVIGAGGGGADLALPGYGRPRPTEAWVIDQETGIVLARSSAFMASAYHVDQALTADLSWDKTVLTAADLDTTAPWLTTQTTSANRQMTVNAGNIAAGAHIELTHDGVMLNNVALATNGPTTFTVPALPDVNRTVHLRIRAGNGTILWEDTLTLGPTLPSETHAFGTSIDRKTPLQNQAATFTAALSENAANIASIQSAIAALHDSVPPSTHGALSPHTLSPEALAAIHAQSVTIAQQLLETGQSVWALFATVDLREDEEYGRAADAQTLATRLRSGATDLTTHLGTLDLSAFDQSIVNQTIDLRSAAEQIAAGAEDIEGSQEAIAMLWANVQSQLRAVLDQMELLRDALQFTGGSTGDTLGVHQSVSLPHIGGSLTVRAIAGAVYSPANLSSGSDTSAVRVDGTGGVLDFVGATHRVTSISGKALPLQTNDQVIAHFYQSSREVGSVTVGADGLFSWEQADGLSSVIFSHSNGGTSLQLNEVTAVMDGSPQTQGWNAPSNESNHSFSQVTASRWQSGQAYNDNPNWNFSRTFGAQNIVGGIRIQAENDFPTEYQVLNARLTGSSQLQRLLYINETGVHEVPADRYRLLSGTSALLYPGAPLRILCEISGNGHTDGPVYTAHSAVAADIMPSATPVISTGFFKWDPQPGAEGWQDVPTNYVNRRVVAVPGSILNSLWEIRNDGLQGTDVTVKVHVGPNGNATDPVQKTFTGSIGGMQRKALSVNVGIGAEKDTVSLEVILGNGQTIIYGRHTQAPQSHEVRVVDPATGRLVWKEDFPLPERSAQQRVAREYARIAQITGNTAMLTAANALLQASTPQAQQVAYTALTTLPITSTTEGQLRTTMTTSGIVGEGALELIEADMGGEIASDFWQSMKQTATLEGPQVQLNVLEQYSYSPNGQLLVPFGTEFVYTNTEAGRIALGIAPLLRDYRSAHWSLARLCARVEQVFGINAQDLYIVAAKSDDQSFPQKLLRLFRVGGYDLTSTPPEGRGVQTQLEYLPDRIRVHFNPSQLQTIDHIWVNLYRSDLANPNVKPNAGFSWKPGQSYIDIPASALHLNIATQLKTIIWWQGGTDATTSFSIVNIDRSKIPAMPINLDGTISGGYSLLADGDPRKKFEEAAITNLAQNFILPGYKDGNYRVDLGSPYHYGAVDYYAFDINRGSGNTDLGDDIVGQPGDHIDDINPSLGTVIIRRTLTIDGHTINIFIRNLHTNIRQKNGEQDVFEILDKDNNVIKIIHKNDELAATGLLDAQGRDVGLIAASVGKTATESAHDHQQASYSIDNDTIKYSLDLSRLIKAFQDNYHWTATATDGGKNGIPFQGDSDDAEKILPKMRYENSVNAFVSDDQKLVYDRSAQLSATGLNNGNFIYFRAWEDDKEVSQMKVVIYTAIDPSTNGWIAWDSSTHDFVKVNGHRQIWTPNSPTKWTSID